MNIQSFAHGLCLVTVYPLRGTQYTVGNRNQEADILDAGADILDTSIRR